MAEGCMNNSLFFRQLHRSLVDIERPVRCIVTRRFLDHQREKLDIHEAIIKRSAVPVSWQKTNRDWLFSRENCALLASEVHLQYGQWKLVTVLHIWNRLRQGFDLEEWYDKAELKSGVHEHDIRTMTKMFRTGDMLAIDLLGSSNFPGVPKGHIIVWDSESPIWTTIPTGKEKQHGK
jgi:hypothetical protein